MGFQALAVRRVGVPDGSTVVITATLSLLFSEAGQYRNRASPIATVCRVAAVLSMFLGAIIGALPPKIGLTVALLLPTAVLTIVAAVYAYHAVHQRK